MSTITPLNGPDANEDFREPSDDHRLALPAFHSIRANSKGGVTRADSGHPGPQSRRSESSHAEQEHGHPLERLSFGGSTGSDKGSKSKDKEKEKENDAPRRQHTRSSGGFLLEPVYNSKRLSRSSLTPPRGESRRKDGGEVSQLSVPKQRQMKNVNPSSSFKSSPLTSEVRPDPVIHHNSSGDQLIPGTNIRRSLSSSQNALRLNGSSASSSHKLEAQRPPPVNVGYDHDPLQIVNMALSLSEGRRRLASGRRYVSAEQNGRRVVSTSSTISAQNTIKKKSIAPFLASRRQGSRNGSPQPKHSDTLRDTNMSAPKLVIDAIPVESNDHFDGDMDFTDSVSPATAARVEKAKAYFELAHEHRRLLPHLPPIRRPGGRPVPPDLAANQKAYNPLQYVRNRKLRIWEKTPIDGEAAGWHDVAKVRDWVTAVVSSHPGTQHDCLECVRLPPLDQHMAHSDGEDVDESLNEPKSGVSPRIPDQHHPKATRPRSDWVTDPADLIADAYWLEQGLNKTKIQDRDNSLIYPPDTQFKFSGWRNKTPIDIPSMAQRPTTPTEADHDDDEEPPPSALPELPTFKSAHNQHKHERRRDKIKDSLQIKDTSSSRDRSRRRPKIFHDTSESEEIESISSNDGAFERGRKRLRRKKQQPHGDDASEKHGDSPAPKQSPHTLAKNHAQSSQGSSAPNSKRSSIDHSALNKLFRVESIKKASPLNRSQNRNDSSRPSSKVLVRSSLDQERLPRASTDYDDTTAPSSPSVVQWPSIAINLSPPPSRNPSPTRKPMSTILHPFHRKPHKDHEQINTADFAHLPPTPAIQHGIDLERHSDGNDSRGTSPRGRGTSPFSKDRADSTQSEDLALHTPREHRLSVASKVSTRAAITGGNEHSKLRGMFKGGRIAELVGHEVSRVGDFIWKREPPAVFVHRGSASDGSLRSYIGSDSEKGIVENGTVVKTPPQANLRSRSSTISSTKSEHMSPTITRISPQSSDRPRYNNPNLPSFTSPFQKDRERQDKKQGLLLPEAASIRPDSTDHISRLAAQHRSASHSPRLDRIPLPKLDTGSATPSNDLSRQKSYGFGAALDLSRSRDATELLNNAISGGTGLKSLRATRSAGDLAPAAGSQASEDAGEESAEVADVSWRDIGRAEALLFSSTVKAREIGRRAEEERTDLPKFFLDTLTPEDRALQASHQLRVKKREQYIFAARNIMRTLDANSSIFNDKMNSFSSNVAPGLHIQLQTIEDMVENTLTPQVRLATDRAGELSMKLTTTSTLAVKGLNDTIGVAFRRRRRGPIRLVRNIWFAGIEWTVVGLLWLIWAVVSVIQLVMGSVRGVLKLTKWLIWID